MRATVAKRLRKEAERLVGNRDSEIKEYVAKTYLDGKGSFINRMTHMYTKESYRRIYQNLKKEYKNKV